MIHGEIKFTGQKIWFSNRYISANITVNKRVRRKSNSSNLYIQVHSYISIIRHIRINNTWGKYICSKYYITKGVCEGDGLRGRGEAPVSVVETGGSGETAEGHVIRDFGGGKVAAASVILKA